MDHGQDGQSHVPADHGRNAARIGSAISEKKALNKNMTMRTFAAITSAFGSSESTGGRKHQRQSVSNFMTYVDTSADEKDDDSVVSDEANLRDSAAQVPAVAPMQKKEQARVVSSSSPSNEPKEAKLADRNDLLPALSQSVEIQVRELSRSIRALAQFSENVPHVLDLMLRHDRSSSATRSNSRGKCKHRKVGTPRSPVEASREPTSQMPCRASAPHTPRSKPRHLTTKTPRRHGVEEPEICSLTEASMHAVHLSNAERAVAEMPS